MKLKTILLFSIILISLTLSCVSAGNFTELQDSIDSSNTTLELESDYSYNYYGNGDTTTISISNLTVNGNNHKITSAGDTCINVTGNVSLNDINFCSANLPIVGSCDNLIINNCTFMDNQKNLFINVKADNMIIKNSRFTPNSIFDYNDFCKITAKSLTIVNSSFTHISNNCRAVELDCDEFKILNSNFTNFGCEYGAAIYTKKGRGEIINSRFINNTAKFGAAIYSTSTLLISECEFTGNSLNRNYGTDEMGGAIYLKASNNIINNSRFISNEGFYHGGAVSVCGDNTKIISSLFEKNSGTHGAVYWLAKSGSITGSRFIDNDGFAVNWIGSNGKITDSQFTDSTHYLDYSVVEWNGANGMVSSSRFTSNKMFSLRWKGANGQVDNCEFSKNNQASVIWQASKGKLTNSVFTECKDCVGWYASYGVMDNCRFEKNTVRAVEWDADYGKIINSKFTNNNVYWDVAEVFGKNCLVDKCEFISNNGKQFGALRWGADDGKIQNSVFKYNTAKWGDGAIDIGNNYLKICKNNVFYKNTPVELDLIDIKPGEIYYASNQVLIFKVIVKNSGKPMKGVKITFSSDLYFPDGYKVFKTNSKGIVTVKGLSKYKGFGPITNNKLVQIPKCYSSYSDAECDLSKYDYFTRDDMDYNFVFSLMKGRCIVKAPKLTAKYHKSKYFKITVKNKFTKKALKKFKIKVKVYTGKKSKTLILKTNKKGVAKFNTKTLSRGNHKVKITSKNPNYYISKKSTVKIK